METESILSDEQKQALLFCSEGKNVFLTGPAGCGKSFILHLIVEKLHSEGKEVAVTGATGVAALNISGKTLHGFLAMGLLEDLTDQVILSKARTASIQSMWNELDTLIIDEISMISPRLLLLVDKIGRVARNRLDIPFGGVQIILCGDFFQLPPVSKKNIGNIYLPYQFCFELPQWKEWIHKTIVLHRVFRQQDDTFIQLLHRIRIAQPTQSDLALLQSRVHAHISSTVGIEPTELRAYNIDVDQINNTNLQRLKQEKEMTYLGQGGYVIAEKLRSKVKVLTDRQKNLIKTVVENCQAKEKTILKKGAQVMLVTNLQVSNGLVNGARGIIKDFSEKIDETDIQYPIVQFTNGKEVKISPYLWKVQDGKSGEVRYSQIPLRLAYCTSIHKSQGCSLDFVSLSLDASLFCPGQAYTALSRVRSLEGLRLLSFSARSIRACPRVVEFYKQLN